MTLFEEFKGKTVAFAACVVPWCLSSLSKLLELRKNDPKVQHNKTVAQFYHSHCTGPEECGRSLLKIRKQAEKESSQTGEDIDDIDTAYLLYNESIIYFHLRQYTKALVILERLFKIVEPIGKLVVNFVIVMIIIIIIHIKHGFWMACWSLA
ncbi:unnamed protein product [Porites evermanni]|uniref:CCR4-NOT transcription complex subunit 10 n=1 Tax=Porites evermanni TaxID=104178 RepID=A0ABN8M6V9_9CNID|nr:unnamed protein product [Porites evermanni]